MFLKRTILPRYTGMMVEEAMMIFVVIIGMLIIIDIIVIISIIIKKPTINIRKSF